MYFSIKRKIFIFVLRHRQALRFAGHPRELNMCRAGGKPKYRIMEENIAFFEEGVKVRCIKRGETRTGLERVVAKLKKKCGSISFIFCTDAYLHKLNEQYLSHDTYTDVITFDYTEKNVFDEPSAEGEPSSQSAEAKKRRMKSNVLSGDIFISIDRIRENAKIFNVKQADELIRVMVHGILHLAGYGDKTPAESKKMREMENLMMAHGFPNL